MVFLTSFCNAQETLGIYYSGSETNPVTNNLVQRFYDVYCTNLVYNVLYTLQSSTNNVDWTNVNVRQYIVTTYNTNKAWCYPIRNYDHFFYFGKYYNNPWNMPSGQTDTVFLPFFLFQTEKDLNNPSQVFPTNCYFRLTKPQTNTESLGVRTFSVTRPFTEVAYGRYYRKTGITNQGLPETTTVQGIELYGTNMVANRIYSIQESEDGILWTDSTNYSSMDTYPFLVHKIYGSPYYKPYFEYTETNGIDTNTLKLQYQLSKFIFTFTNGFQSFYFVATNKFFRLWHANQ